MGLYDPMPDAVNVPAAFVVASVKYRVPPGPVMIAESKFWKPRMDGLTGTDFVNVGVVEPAAISSNSLPAGAVNQRLAPSTAIPTVEGSGTPCEKKVQFTGLCEGLLGLLIPTWPPARSVNQIEALDPVVNAIAGGLPFVALVATWFDTLFVLVSKTPISFAVGSVNQIAPFELTSCVGPPLVLLLSSAEYSWMAERSCRSSKGSKSSGLRRVALRQARSLPVSVVFGLSRCRGLILSILAMQIHVDSRFDEECGPVQIGQDNFCALSTESKRYSMPPSSASFNLFLSR